MQAKIEEWLARLQDYNHSYCLTFVNKWPTLNKLLCCIKLLNLIKFPPGNSRIGNENVLHVFWLQYFKHSANKKKSIPIQFNFCKWWEEYTHTERTDQSVKNCNCCNYEEIKFLFIHFSNFLFGHFLLSSMECVWRIYKKENVSRHQVHKAGQISSSLDLHL